MKTIYLFVISNFLLSINLLNAQQTANNSKNPILDQLFGEWDAFQITKNPEGSWSNDTTYSQWHWYPILEGDAIQDDWIKIVNDKKSKQSPQIVGRNIRIYNKAEEQWHMVWIGRGFPKLATFTAKNENDRVIMSGKNINGRDIKNTFFNISKESFDWKQEWTFDSGNSWVEVSIIHCKRRM